MMRATPTLRNTVKENRHKTFFEKLGAQLGVSKLEDWYNIPTREVLARPGTKTILTNYHNSHIEALKKLYPEHSWKTWSFPTVPRGYWDQLRNQREFLDYAAKELGIKKWEEWYEVSNKDIERLGGLAVLNKHGGSLPSMVAHNFPEHNWLPWKFVGTTKGVWEHEDAQRQLVKFLEDNLAVKSPEDWYKVSMQRIGRLVPQSIFKEKGLFEFLKTAYPQHKWDPVGLAQQAAESATSPKLMVEALKKIFPGQEVIGGYSSESMKLRDGTKMEFDCYYPKQKLLFDFRGEQHFHDDYVMGPKINFVEKDKEKRAVAKERGLTLVEVPYWWDGSQESLTATIYQNRPDVLSKIGTGKPIPKEPSEGWKDSQAVPLTFAQSWTPKIDPTGWHMSEKFDGVRAYWDGTKLMTKQGREIFAPTQFTQNLPKVPLDGELWLGRGRYETLLNLVDSPDSDWREMRFMVFDLPASEKPYEARMQELRGMKLPSNVTVIETTKCNGQQHLQQYADLIMETGGEGVMLVKPGSSYTVGRSTDILKLQRTQDAKLRVTEVMPIGLKCEQPNFVQVVIPCDSIVLKNPPKVGSPITVKHTGHLPNGSLKHPYFWRNHSETPKEKGFYPTTTPAEMRMATPTPIKWTSKQNRKEFFDNFFKQRGMMKLDDWYNVTEDEIRKAGGSELLDRFYAGSLANALEVVYPDHKWIPWQFRTTLVHGFWDKVENHKKFFDWLGREFGLISFEQWYKVRPEDITRNGGAALMKKYGSIASALSSVYPEYKWIPWKFHPVPRGFWNEIENQRKFFDWLDKDRHLDSFFIRKHGGGGLLDRYDGSPSKAVQAIYGKQ